MTKTKIGQATMGNFICYPQMIDIDAEVLCSSSLQQKMMDLPEILS